MSKRERLDALLAERDLEAVWFARPNSVAWLTGANSVVDREADVGVAAVGYDGDGLEAVTNNVEADRLRDEELPDDVRVAAFDWYESSLAEAVADRSPDPAAADFDVPGMASVDASPLRQPLTDADVETYRELGRETAAAVEAVCRELQPGDAESEVASALRVALSARGIESPVALVGGAERARRYRHYTPTDAELGGYALVSVTAQRDGLHASATRTVAFASELDDESLADLRERHDAARTVEATALAATREFAGGGERGETAGTASDVFAAIRDAYEAVGYPDEWREHHQGGAAGFAGREWFGAPDADDPVTAPMAYAWNPTVAGAKSEDTVLVADGELEVLTDTGRWPTTAVAPREDDATVERPDVLVVGDEA
ncbi:M24 family metallopeptidase [Halorussus halobius]|uniref:M24 family metallopeptidase n=1 Tax=Halorussus halobius TaxID=1710537 RepID=UPI0010920145|nr:M24 family metallopeptidase [Halorussus halobius]